jgi:molybdopterin adenylyltransferase
VLTIAVITVSDRAFAGHYPDESGPRIIQLLKEEWPQADVSYTLVADDPKQLHQALQANIGRDYIFTTGGTGISPRDFTPEVTAGFCQKELPGIAEMLRAESMKQTKNAVFSRGYAGFIEKTVVVNFPGSVKAADFCTRLMIPLLLHGKKMLWGESH